MLRLKTFVLNKKMVKPWLLFQQKVLNSTQEKNDGLPDMKDILNWLAERMNALKNKIVPENGNNRNVPEENTDLQEIVKFLKTISETDAGRAVAAAKSGNIGEIKSLLNSSMDINEDNKCELGADVTYNKTQKTFQSLLCKSITDVNVCDSSGRNIMFHFADIGLTEVCRELINAGAILGCDKSKVNLLHLAAAGGHADTCQLLCELNVNVNVRDSVGFTPLHNAVCEGHVEACKVLLRYGAEIDVKTCTGDDEKDDDEYDSDYYSDDDDDDRMAHPCEWTPLQLAIDNGHIDVCRLLCEAGADINLFCDEYRHNNTALFLAARSGRTDICRMLCESGADVNLYNNYETALSIAAWKGYTDVCKLLCETGADMNLGFPLHNATDNDHTDVCRVLCEAGADVNLHDQDTWTALHKAAYYGYLNVVKLLVQHKADVNVCNKNDKTALYYAANNGHADVCRVLCEAGADVNLCDGRNWTALHKAAHRGYLNVVELLVQHKADVTLKTSCKLRGTALELAQKQKKTAVVQYLSNITVP